MRNHLKQVTGKLGFVHADGFRPLAQPGHGNSAELQCGRHRQRQSTALACGGFGGCGASASGTSGTTLTCLGYAQADLSLRAAHLECADCCSQVGLRWLRHSSLAGPAPGCQPLRSLVRIECRLLFFFSDWIHCFCVDVDHAAVSCDTSAKRTCSSARTRVKKLRSRRCGVCQWLRQRQSTQKLFLLL